MSSSHPIRAGTPSTPLGDPLRRATISDLLRRRALRDPRRPAVAVHTSGGERVELTYRELNDLANAMAGVLTARGVTRGDVVASMAPDGVDHIVTYFATLKLGAAFTSFNPALTAVEARYLVESTAPRVLIHDRAISQLVDSVAGDLPSDLVALDSPNDTVTPDTELHGLLTDTDRDEPDVAISESDLAMIMYTSGTESLPKGVRIPHRNFLIATIPAWVGERYVEGDDRFLLLAPMYTMAGVGTITNLIAAGACVVIPASHDVDHVAHIIGRERVTNVSQTPTYYSKLIDSGALAGADLTSLRQCHTYGGSIPKRVVETLSQHAPDAMWATYWGQTELSQLGSLGFYRDLSEIPDGDTRWIGKPVPQVEILVVDDEGRPTDVGELLCRSPAMMEGYHNAPDLTEEVLRGGWLHTGDIVRVDEESNLFFYDRKKDVIKSGGMNISSLEVENAIVDHPSASAVAVVGRPHEYWSEVVTAYVVPTEGRDRPEDARALLEHARTRLAAYKVPKEVIFVASLPRDRQGKIVKRELRPSAGP